MKVVTVFTTYNDIEANMISNLLEEHGIPCQVISDIAHSVFPFTHDHKLSEVRIAVNEQELSRAEEIIDEFLNSTESEFSPTDDINESDEVNGNPSDQDPI